MAEFPQEVVDVLVELGKAEWGATKALTAEEHAAHTASSVRLTAQHFGQESSQPMHGLYVAGTETVICHTGTSPNSPQTARALTAAWNRMVDEARAIKAAQASPQPRSDKEGGE